MSDATEKARELRSQLDGWLTRVKFNCNEDRMIALDSLNRRVAALLAQARLEEARWWVDGYKLGKRYPSAERRIAELEAALEQAAGEGGGK